MGLEDAISTPLVITGTPGTLPGNHERGNEGTLHALSFG